MKIPEQVELLMQGTDYGDPILKNQMALELKDRLRISEDEGRPLEVYCGFDPRTSDLHIGHTIPMRKLRQFQELGHHVTFLIGTATSMIGDPSDKDRLRPLLTTDEIEENARTYAEQAFKILDPKETSVRYNHEWLFQLSLEDLIALGGVFTLQQFLQREAFKLRWDKDEPVYLHETFYSLMQAYDAVYLHADVQVGGSDQLFNIMTAGRKVQKARGQKPQVGVIVGILPGTDGTVKMSKSLGNNIPILATPEDMYGKVMSIPDRAMGLYMRLVTRWTPSAISALEGQMAKGEVHPRDAKMRLAREIVEIFHGAADASAAETHFVRVFQESAMPSDMPEFRLTESTRVVDVVCAAKMAPSKSQARRLIEQGGVRIDGAPVASVEAVVEPGSPRVLQVGKRAFLRLVS